MGLVKYIIDGIKYRFWGGVGLINRIFYKNPRIMDSVETIKLIAEEKRSLCRLGDGEFNLIFGRKLGFQEVNHELANELRKIVCDENTSCLIGIPDVFGKTGQYRKNQGRFGAHISVITEVKSQAC